MKLAYNEKSAHIKWVLKCLIYKCIKQNSWKQIFCTRYLFWAKESQELWHKNPAWVSVILMFPPKRGICSSITLWCDYELAENTQPCVPVPPPHKVEFGFVRYLRGLVKHLLRCSNNVDSHCEITSSPWVFPCPLYRPKRESRQGSCLQR